MRVFLTICGLLSIAFCFGLAFDPHSPSVPSSGEFVLGFIFWLAFTFSGIAAIDSIRRWRASGNVAYAYIAVLFVPTLLYGTYWIFLVQKHNQNVAKQWQAVTTAGAINPLLFRYHELHPERFRYTGSDDEVEVTGFTEYALSQSTALSDLAPVKDGHLVDPWGRRFHFALNRGNEREILVCGWKYPNQSTSAWTTATITLGIDGKPGETRVGNLNYSIYDDFVATN